MTARASRKRMVGARVLVGLFVVFALVGLLGGYIRYQALDNATVRTTAEQLIGDEEVRDQIATSLVDQLYANVDVDERLAARLPADQQGLAGVLAAALRELSDRAARELLARPRAQALWVESISRTHQQLLKVLDDDVRGFTTENGVVVLDLRPLVLQLGDQVAIFGRVAEALPEDAGRVEIMEADQLETAQDITQLLKVLGPIMWILALLAAVGALWLAAGRRRAILRSLSVALVAVGLLILVVLRVFGDKVVDTLAKSEGVRPAVEHTWLIVTGLLGDGAWTAIGVGIVLLAGVWLVGESRPATRSRSFLAPYLARPELAFGGGALFLLLIVWWGPTAQTRRWDFLLLAVVLLAVAIEALRRATAHELEAGPAPDPQPESTPATTA